MARITLDIILSLLKEIDKHNFKVTSKSLTHVPEYYLNVHLGEKLSEKGFSIEFEMPTRELIDVLQIPKEKITDELRSGNIDLVLKTGIKESVKHLVELKRNSKVAELHKDIKRLSLFAKISNKRSTNRSFLIFTTTAKESNVHQKLDSLAIELGVNITYLNFKSCCEHTRKTRSYGRDVHVWCCQIV